MSEKKIELRVKAEGKFCDTDCNFLVEKMYHTGYCKLFSPDKFLDVYQERPLRSFECLKCEKRYRLKRNKGEDNA